MKMRWLNGRLEPDVVGRMRISLGPCASCGAETYRDVQDEELNTKEQNIEFRKRWDEGK